MKIEGEEEELRQLTVGETDEIHREQKTEHAG
jgi:hypothetical protein